MANILLAVISGIFTALAFDFPGTSFLAWFSLVPFFSCLAKNKPKQGVLCAFVFGFVFHLAAIFWIGNVTKLGFLVLACYLSLYSLLFYAAFRFFADKPLKIITLPCLWVAIEFLKENVWCGFGWLNLGYSQYENIFLIQPADIFGVKLISFIILAVNVLLWETLKEKRILVKKTVFVSCVILACFVYSSFRLSAAETVKHADITIIQPNTAEGMKWRDNTKPYIIGKLKALSEKSQAGSLVVFPEACWPVIASGRELRLIQAFAKSAARDILIGAVEEMDGRFYNSAIMAGSSGRISGIYRKIKLVPFGEYVPGRNYLKWINVINEVGDMNRGEKYEIFSCAAGKFSVLICFEDTFPVFVSKSAMGRDFLVNITNDEWFKGNPQARQHLAIMAFRAVENRISIIRCANTGISGWVDFKGNVYRLGNKGKEVFTQGAWNSRVELNKRRSFYNKFPEIFPILCAAYLFFFAFVKIKVK